MGRFKATTFLALVILTYASAINPWQELVPNGKEVIYKYHALVKAGTDKPHTFASTFALEGKLHVQIDATDMLLLRLSDIKYTMDNGKEDAVRETIMLPLPEHMKLLQTTFKIKLLESGKAAGVVVENNEPEFIVNMKKAIGSIMQLDIQNIKLNSVKSHAFLTSEKSIYGEDDVFYNVLPDGDFLTVQKLHEMTTTHHLYHHSFYKTEPSYCAGHFEDPLSHDNQRIYTIKRTSGHNTLATIESNGGIYLHRHQAQGVAMYVFVNQTFLWQETIDKTDKFVMKSEHTYDSFETDLTGAPFEVVPDKQTLIPVVKQMLGEIVEYMQHNHIHTKRPDFKQGQLINRITKVLVHFDTTMLQDIVTSLKTKTEPKDIKMLTIFYELLPLIGTKDSLKFIVTLVKEKQVKESVALELLKSMSFYVRTPTKHMIQAMDSLLHLNDLSWSVQKMAILGFSNMLRKADTFKHKHFLDNFASKTDDHHHQHNVKVQETDLIEKYITDFINKVKTSQKREEQLLYMLALHNLKTEKVLNQLEPAVKGEWWNDDDLRLMAMWAASPVAMKHPQQAYELYWPILTDRKLPMELRATAFFVLVKAQPTLSRLINIYWFMQTETDHELYEYYYSYLKVMSETNNPCNHEIKLFAKQLLIYTPMPYLHGLSGFHIMSYHDTKFNFGDEIQLQIVNSPSAVVMSIAMNKLSANTLYNAHSIYIKVSGLGSALLENFKLNTINNLKLFNYDELRKVLEDGLNKEHIQIEVTLLEADQVVDFMYFDSSNIQKMPALMKIWYEQHVTEKKQFINIDYDLFGQFFIPTEIGFPALYSIMYPEVDFGSYEISKEVKDQVSKINFDVKYQIWKHGSYGLAFHNSFSNVWQGINRFLSYDFTLPLSVSIGLNPEQQTLTFTSHRKGSGFATRSHASLVVYVKDYVHNGNLKKTSPTAKKWVAVTHDDKFKSEPITTGDYTIYDVDNAIADKTFEFESVEFTAITPVDKYIMTSLHKDAYMFMQPDIVTRGILEDDLGNPTDNIIDELTIRLNLELNTKVYAYLPAMRINSRITYTAKKEQNPITTLNVNALLDINSGHTNNNLKMQITLVQPDSESYKMCVEGNEQYTDETITGVLEIGVSSTVEGKCTKDDRILHINATGKEVPKDKQFSANYDVCHKPIWSQIHGMKPYTCYTTLSSIRDYVIHVKTLAIPEYLKTKTIMLLPYSLGDNLKVYTSADKPQSHDYEIHLKYPMNENEFDVEVHGTNTVFKFENIKRNDMTWYGIYPDNTQYSNQHRIMHVLGLNDVCTVDSKHVTNVKHHTKEVGMTDWVLIVGDSAQNTKHGVWIKLMDDKLAMKIVHNDHVLLVLPHKGEFTVTLDGTTVEDQMLSRDWFHYDIMVDPVAFVFLSKYLGHHIVFNGDQLQMEIPKMNMEMVGLCYDK